jgi:hypothetical protein
LQQLRTITKRIKALTNVSGGDEFDVREHGASRSDSLVKNQEANRGCISDTATANQEVGESATISQAQVLSVHMYDFTDDSNSSSDDSSDIESDSADLEESSATI